MYNLSVGTNGKLEVANERGQIARRGIPSWPRPTTIFTTPRVGPVIVTVPSGGLFGLDPEEKVVSTLPASVESFYLPEGGTVAVQLRGRIDSQSTMSGELTTGQNDDE